MQGFINACFPTKSSKDSLKLRSGTDSDTRIYPENHTIDSDGEESPNLWGFTDTCYTINPEGVVEITGARYASSGQKLPALFPWICAILELDLSPEKLLSSSYPPSIPAPSINNEFITCVKEFLEEDQISTEAKQRIRHGHGHTQDEVYAINYGQTSRVPDLVLYPEDKSQAALIVKLAQEKDVCLIPFGGGTNVSHALRCPKDEQRMIVSVDMRRMNRIEWIDPVNRTASIQAGAVGRHIAAELAKYGFTIGHEPDSMEWSTMGGWVATKASGMKKNKYGNIEDIVLDIEVITPSGTLSRSNIVRESVGSDPRLWMFGSEGNVGLITSAVVKLFPIPKVQRYGSVLFPSFQQGLEFMYSLTQEGVQPASVRLVDNMQFQFGIALKPESKGMDALKGRLQKAYVTKFKNFNPQEMVVCTLVFEGTPSEVRRQESAVYRISKHHQGLKAGPENGKRGYELTFAIAYIRDFAMKMHVMAESFETSCPWSRALELCTNVKNRVHREYKERKLLGKPYVTCRISQVYDTGVTIYFYVAAYLGGVDSPSQIYAELEEAARDEVLKCGGSLSHHHGVGKLRQKFLPRVLSPAAINWNRKMKEAIDPSNIFGCRNMALN